MKKYFAIFAAVALLGMLAIYFVPDKKITSAVKSDTSNTATITPTPQVSSTPASTPTPVATATATPTASAATGSSLKNGTYKGATSYTRFGNVQVSITVSGGKITAVNNLQLPQDDQRSAQISSYAGAQLQSQALAAQSANIDGVSGATYTSQGYAESLQAAIDAAKS